ncbi:MAG: response regulator transcription factor [Promicromonosporaceae bacterium]|nr:response regulator transcription factor [Promicromonosporaceae bacterium]
MIRITFADDERLVRDAIAALLDLEEDVSVVGVASDGVEAVTLAREMRPDVAVTDLRMPSLDGIGIAAQLAAEDPPIPTLIVTSFALPGTLRAALDAGAAGFAPKNTPATEVAEIIRKIAVGRMHIDPGLAVEAMALGNNPLTPRERELLRQAAGGAPIREIAKQAELSSATARNHLSAAVIKLRAANRHEAVHIAKSRGWI